MCGEIKAGSGTKQGQLRGSEKPGRIGQLRKTKRSQVDSINKKMIRFISMSNT